MFVYVYVVRSAHMCVNDAYVGMCMFMYVYDVTSEHMYVINACTVSLQVCVFSCMCVCRHTGAHVFIKACTVCMQVCVCLFMCMVTSAHMYVNSACTVSMQVCVCSCMCVCRHIGAYICYQCMYSVYVGLCAFVCVVCMFICAYEVTSEHMWIIHARAYVVLNLCVYVHVYVYMMVQYINTHTSYIKNTCVYEYIHIYMYTKMPLCVCVFVCIFSRDSARRIFWDVLGQNQSTWGLASPQHSTHCAKYTTREVKLR